MNKLVLELNEQLITQDLNYLPFVRNLASSVKHSYNDQNETVVLTFDSGSVTLKRVAGISLQPFVEKNKFKEDILSNFSSVESIEKKYADNLESVSFKEELEPITNRLKELYKKLAQTYWVVSTYENEQVLEDTKALLLKKLAAQPVAPKMS